MPITNATALQLAQRAGRGDLKSTADVLNGLVRGAGKRTYAGSPISAVTPYGIGELLMDTTNSVLYVATGTTSADWAAVGLTGITQTELAVLDGLGVPQAELQSVDPSQKSRLFDDFLAAGIDTRWSSTAGSGTGNAAATTVAGALNGEITIKSASNDGTDAANASNLTADQLNWKANAGGLFMEARVKLDLVTAVALFVGFTDTISTTVEMPIFLVTTDIDSTATDACGILFDTDGTTAQWCHGGVKADVDTVPAYNGAAPAADTYVTLRVEVSAAGAVQGFVNGTAIGAAVANAVTPTVALTPCLIVNNRGAAQRILTVDYIDVMQNR